MRRLRQLLLGSVLLAPALPGQAPPEPAGGDGPWPPAAADARRVCRVGRIEATQAPVIDGDLHDACWATAPEIGELVMVEPWEGRRPEQRTVVRLLHDRHHLYLAVWCYDSHSHGVRATQRARDARLDPDDRVELLFDPFQNRRTAYWFQIGAGGSLGDAIVSQNGNRFEKPWDAIWEGEARVTDQGWQAELAIPFRSIPRKQGATSWGFNLRRINRSDNEEYQWNNPVQAVPFFRVSELGTMTGLGEIDGGIGLDVVPYVALDVRRQRSVDRDFDTDPDAGGDLFYRITPELTLAATLFTDFAETENDERQINLNRFPLFFPEKRDFFLEGSSYFSFGSSRSFGGGGGTTFLPFFSRRIGLDSGNKIPLLAGLKLTGEAGPLEVGLLSVATDDTGPVADRRNLSVLRLKYALAEQTTVGLIGTNGRPVEDGDSQTFGVDFAHRVPRFLGDTDLQIGAELVGSHTSGPDGDGETVALEARGRGREWDYGLASRWTSREFNPELGFLRRAGTKQVRGDLGYSPRFAEGGTFRNARFELQAEAWLDWDGSAQELEFELDSLGLETHDGDRFNVSVERGYERVDEDFTVFRGEVTIFAADYWATRYGTSFSTSEGRAVGVSGSASWGDFFDGQSLNWRLGADWRTSALLILGAEYRSTIADLPGPRDFTTHIAEARVDLHLDPRLSLRNLVQFDNESEDLGFQSRLRWIYAPGSDLFVVLGLGWVRGADEVIRPDTQSVTVKLVHTLRF